MLRKLIRTAPAVLLAAVLVALPAAAGTGLEVAWPARLVDLVLSWLPDLPRTGVAPSGGTVTSIDPGGANGVPEAGLPAPDGEAQSSSEGEVHPSLDPNG